MPAQPAKSPAEIVIDKFGRKGIGIPDIATGLSVSKTTVYRWLYAREPRKDGRSGRHIGGTGCGGTIPAKYHTPLLTFATARGVRLVPRDLIDGR